MLSAQLRTVTVLSTPGVLSSAGQFSPPVLNQTQTSTNIRLGTQTLIPRLLLRLGMLDINYSIGALKIH